MRIMHLDLQVKLSPPVILSPVVFPFGKFKAAKNLFSMLTSDPINTTMEENLEEF